MRKYHKSLAYTLIEVLFIIVIVGIIAALGLNAFQQRASNIKIDQTMLQFQQWLQAAAAYYADNDCWPTSTSCSTATPPAFNTSTYVPIMGNDPNNPKNPWGKPYTFSLNQNTQQFTITTLGVPQAAALRIASQLPNITSFCRGTNCGLTATAFSPFMSDVLGSNISTPAFSEDDSVTTTAVFTCPAGWTATTLPILSGILPQNGSRIDEICIYTSGMGAYATDKIYTAGNYCVAQNPPTNTVWKCFYVVFAKAGRSEGAGQGTCNYSQDSLKQAKFTYLSYCINPNPQFNTQASPANNL